MSQTKMFSLAAIIQIIIIRLKNSTHSE